MKKDCSGKLGQRSTVCGCQVVSIMEMGGQQRFGTSQAMSWRGWRLGFNLQLVVQSFMKAGIEAPAIHPLQLDGHWMWNWTYCPISYTISLQFQFIQSQSFILETCKLISWSCHLYRVTGKEKNIQLSMMLPDNVCVRGIFNRLQAYCLILRRIVLAWHQPSCVVVLFQTPITIWIVRSRNISVNSHYC